MLTTQEPLNKEKFQLISIVVPIYNEEESIHLLYDKIREQNAFDWEIIMVNDGSTDASADRLRELAEKDARVKVINLRRNYGQTAAMAAGFNFAHGDVVVPLDADLQNDPSDIPQLLSVLAEGYDVVSGWRKERWQDKRLSRKLPSLLANILISRITGTTLHDYGCTLKAYRRTVLNDVKLYGEMHRYIPAFAAWQGARVTEIPVHYHKRRFGKTKYGMSRIFRVILDLVTVKFLIGYSTKPMHFFGKFGVWSLIVSAVAGGLAIDWKIYYGTSLISTPLPLFAALFFIVGVQLILMGLVAEMMTRNYYETSGRPIYNVKDTLNM